MRKFLKNQKGFTLIELMMVIAVIGILAAVLIPKLSGIKDSAKDSGTQSNFRQVQAAVEGNIARYQGSTYAASDLASKLNGMIGSSFMNPFDSNLTGAQTYTTATALTSAGVTKAVVLDTVNASAPTSLLKGTVYVNLLNYKSTGVVITSYDDAGSAMDTATVTK